MINTSKITEKWQGLTLTRKCQTLGFLLGVSVAAVATCGGLWLCNRNILPSDLAPIFGIFWSAVFIGPTALLMQMCGWHWEEFGGNLTNLSLPKLAIILAINSFIWGFAGLIVGHCIALFKRRRMEHEKSLNIAFKNELKLTNKL